MIEQLDKKDINQIMDIWLQVNKKTHNYIPEKYWEDNVEYVKEEILKAKVYVYKNNNEVCGFIGLVNTYIAGIFVKEKYQSKGIGKKLMKACQSEYTILTLSVYEKNKRAIEFYKKAGFKIAKEETNKETKEKTYEMLWKNTSVSFEEERKNGNSI